MVWLVALVTAEFLSYVIVCMQVMTVVKGLTKTGITICATIHNPTPYCFNLFDRLMILLHGRVVYSGENGAQPNPCSLTAPCAVEGRVNVA